MKPKLRLARFDFDGTLADSLGWFRSTVQSGAERFGYRRTGDAELEALRCLSTREVVRALGVPSRRMPQLARHFRYEAARSLPYAKRPALEAAEPDLIFGSFASLVRQITDAVPSFRPLEPGGRGD